MSTEKTYNFSEMSDYEILKAIEESLEYGRKQGEKAKAERGWTR